MHLCLSWGLKCNYASCWRFWAAYNTCARHMILSCFYCCFNFGTQDTWCAVDVQMSLKSAVIEIESVVEWGLNSCVLPCFQNSKLGTVNLVETRGGFPNGSVHSVTFVNVSAMFSISQRRSLESILQKGCEMPLKNSVFRLCDWSKRCCSASRTAAGLNFISESRSWNTSLNYKITLLFICIFWKSKDPKLLVWGLLVWNQCKFCLFDLLLYQSWALLQKNTLSFQITLPKNNLQSTNYVQTLQLPAASSDKLRWPKSVWKTPGDSHPFCLCPLSGWNLVTVFTDLWPGHWCSFSEPLHLWCTGAWTNFFFCCTQISEGWGYLDVSGT